MKTIILFLTFMLCLSSSYSQALDTLNVNQHDSTIFNANIEWIQRPCSKPEWSTTFELISPQKNTYYLIYNKENQLVKEGLYSTITVDSVAYDGILNAKNYTYYKNGKIQSIFYQENGRNLKHEYYNKRGKLKKIKYL